METNQRQPLPPSRIADAHKSWACFLVGTIPASLLFRRNIPLEVVTAFLAVASSFFALKALRLGPLRLLGGVFLALNAWLLIGVMMVWFAAL